MTKHNDIVNTDGSNDGSDKGGIVSLSAMVECMNELEAYVRSKEQQLVDALHSYEKMSKRHDAMETRLAEWKRKFEQSQSVVENLSKAMEAFETKQQLLREATHKLQEAHDEGAHLRTELSALQQQHADTKCEHQKAVNTLEQQVADTTTERDQLQHRYDQKQDNFMRVREELRALKIVHDDHTKASTNEIETLQTTHRQQMLLMREKTEDLMVKVRNHASNTVATSVVDTLKQQIHELKVQLADRKRDATPTPGRTSARKRRRRQR